MNVADWHGVREAGAVDAESKRPLRYAGLEELHRLDHLLMEVLGRLVGHLEVQVVRVQPGDGKQSETEDWTRFLTQKVPRPFTSPRGHGA